MNSAHATGTRLLSLDVFRGLTIAGMVLVNNQGDWNNVYPALRHAAWHGWLGADLVFPFFLFAVGASLVFSITPLLQSGVARKVILIKIIRRALIIIGLGLALNLFSCFFTGTMRIPGVLQRIGLCYFFSAILFLFAGRRARIIIVSSALFIYGALLLFVTPAGIGCGSLEPCCNLPGFIDGALFPGHTYEHAPYPGFDPEGLLSAIPAVASAMAGVFAAEWLRACGTKKKTAGLIAGGTALAAAGLAADYIIPINKNLWTPSYVLFMGGLAIIVFALLYHFYDAAGHRLCSITFLALGRNAIAVYILSSLAGRAMISLHLFSSPVPIKTTIFNSIFQPWFRPGLASLFYAVSFLLFWWGIMYILYRKRIFISL